MIRRALIAVITLGMAGWLVASPTSPAPALFAQDEGSGDEAATPVATTMLDLGDRYSMDGWELEIQDTFMEESPRRVGYDELRLSVAFRTIGEPLPYYWDVFTGVPGYPALQLRDAVGEVWDIPIHRPASNLFPGSAQHTVEPGIPAHWTIGFDVPQSASDEMQVEAVWNDVVVAAWDLGGVPAAARGWDTPPGSVNALIGDTIEWSDAVDVTPVGHSVAACGDPDIERQTAVYLLVVEVENLTDRDALFPDVRYPEVAGNAVWMDGSSARNSDVWTFGPTDEDLVIYNRRNAEQVIVPPRTSGQLALVFAAPRDPRLVDSSELPIGVHLTNPAGSSWWFDVAAQPGGELLNDACLTMNAVGSAIFGIGLPDGFTLTPAEEPPPEDDDV